MKRLLLVPNRSVGDLTNTKVENITDLSCLLIARFSIIILLRLLHINDMNVYNCSISHNP